MDVSRASQVHQMPQMTRPQMLPLTMFAIASTSETSVTAAAVLS